MKKYTSIIAFCLVVLLCVPSISVKAIDKQDYCLRMRSTVLDAFSDTNYQNWLNWYVWLSDDSVMNNIRSALSNFDVSNFNDYYYYVIGVSYDSQSGSQYNHTLRVWVFNSTLDPYLMYKRTANQSWSVFGDHANNVGRYYRCSVSNLNYGTWVRDADISFNQTYYASNDYGYADFGYGSLLDTNVPAFNVNEYNTVNGGSPSDADYRAFCVDHSWATNLFPASLNGYDLQGNIVNQDPSFSFSDTAYNGGISFDYQQTHLYTEYNNAQGANETCVFKWALDSRSQSITQTTTDWKMHYYVIVNWHWTQATDSSVYTPLLSGGSGGQMAFEFDDTPEFIMQGKTKISIWDLVQNIPTISSVRDEDIVSLAVAVSCLNGNIVNSVWRDIFGQSGQYVSDVASEIISGGKLEVQGVGEVGGGFLNNLFNPAYYYALDDLRVNVVAHPWSQTLGIHGGNGDFDLNLRSNDSYGTTQGYVDDGGTPNDPSDDTQYPTNTVPQQNNVVVPVTYPTSGGNVTVYSVVQVPDSGGGGGNSINYSPTFSPSIVMDSGLDDLKETVDAYPQVPNQHFWDYFLVFKDNAFLDATSDFFGALPNELSSLLISSIGIIGVFAIYRFVRRR